MKKLKAFYKQNKDMVLLFAIPLVLALFVVVYSIVPGLLANPSYAFIYEECDYYCGSNTSYYVDDNGRLRRYNDYDSRIDDYGVRVDYGLRANIRPNTLYLYNPVSGEHKAITIDQANSYQLSSSRIAPDGYEFVTGYESGSGFLFDYSGDYKTYLKKGFRQKSVNLAGNSDRQANFIGWIINTQANQVVQK